MKNGHLLRFPHPSSLQRTAKYASLLGISEALRLTLFDQPGKGDFFNSELDLVGCCFVHLRFKHVGIQMVGHYNKAQKIIPLQFI
jgi:hypothetical protein